MEIIIIFLIICIPMILFIIVFCWIIRKIISSINKTIVKGANKILPTKLQMREDYLDTPEGQKAVKNIDTAIKLFNHFNKK